MSKIKIRTENGYKEINGYESPETTKKIMGKIKRKRAIRNKKTLDKNKG